MHVYDQAKKDGLMNKVVWLKDNEWMAQVW